MDSKFINRIEELSVSPDDLRKLLEADWPEGVTPVSLAPVGTTIYDLEGYLPAPVRYRGTFISHSIDAWADYVALNLRKEKTCVFVDTENMSGQAILDNGTQSHPEWAVHRAKITLEKLSPFAALMNASDQRRTQEAFIDWCVDWMPNLSFYSSKTELEVKVLPINQAITALRKIKVNEKRESEHTEQDLSRSKSAFHQIEMSGRDILPTHMEFTCEPYMEFQERTIECRLVYTEVHGEIHIAFKIVGEERMLYELTEEFVRKIRSHEKLKPIEEQIYLGHLVRP